MRNATLNMETGANSGRVQQKLNFSALSEHARQAARVQHPFCEVSRFFINIQSFRKQLLTQSSKNAATNPRGIPYAPFVDKVEDYVSSRPEVDGTMKSFQEMISYDESQSYGL